MQTLTQKGLLTSYKGPKGGISLARSPQELTVLQVVEAIDGVEFLQKCVVGMPSCGGDHPCALHDKWFSIREGIYAMLADKSIAQLIDGK